MARFRSLTLRARFRAAFDGGYLETTHQTRAGVLSRGADELFHGTFTLPADAVLAAFVVENPDAHHVDANGGMLWNLPVYDADKPSRHAMEQRFNDMLARSPDEALVLARRQTDLYPDDPSAWAIRV